VIQNPDDLPLRELLDLLQSEVINAPVLLGGACRARGEACPLRSAAIFVLARLNEASSVTSVSGRKYARSRTPSKEPMAIKSSILR